MKLIKKNYSSTTPAWRERIKCKYTKHKAFALSFSLSLPLPLPPSPSLPLLQRGAAGEGLSMERSDVINLRSDSCQPLYKTISMEYFSQTLTPSVNCLLCFIKHIFNNGKNAMKS